MAQQLFASLTAPSLVNLDANFTEVYRFAKNLYSDDSGNVAIGHASPITALDIRSAGTYQLRIQGTTASGGSGVQLFNDSSAYGIGLVTYGSSYVGGSLFSVGANGSSICTSGTGAFGIGTGIGSTAPLQLGTNGAARLLIENSGATRAAADNAQTLGSSSYRWSTVYAATGTINTSDRREKTAVVPLTAGEIAAAKQLAGELGSFRFLAAVAEKGAGARLHIGMTVQRAMDIMVANGLDPLHYGFICHDAWQAQTVPARHEQRATGLLDAAGQPLVDWVLVEPERVIPAGDRYGFRADELLLFLARGFDARLQALEAAA